jgi:hypothetical protein
MPPTGDQANRIGPLWSAAVCRNCYLPVNHAIFGHVSVSQQIVT